MANKKVSQLTSKPSVLVTDLFPIADPSTGQLYKTTISDLGTAIGSGVSSVNGLVGAVVLDTDDIQELVSPTNKWFTDTRARAALSASSPLAYNSGTGVFSIPAATSSQNGYLTSTDWTTFNNKLSTATAASTYVPYTGATANVNLGQNYSLTAALIIKSGGTSTQFLKADGTIDTNTYALDSAVVKLTGNQTIAGVKTFTSGIVADVTTGGAQGFASTNSSASGSSIFLQNNSTSVGNAIGINNTSTADGIAIGNETSGRGIYISNATTSGSGKGISIDNYNGGIGIEVGSDSTADAIKILHLSGRAFNIQSSGGGYGVIINNTTASTSAPFTIQKQGANKITFTDAGAGTFVSTISAAGATLTGALSGTTANFSSLVSIIGTSADFILVRANNSNTANILFGTNNTYSWSAGLRNIENENFYIYNQTNSTNSVTINNSTNAVTLAGALSGTSATFSGSVIVGTTALLNFGPTSSFVGMSGNNSTGALALYANNTQVLGFAATSGAATFSSSVTATTSVFAYNNITDPTTGNALTNGTTIGLNGTSSNNSYGLGVGASRGGLYDMWFQTGVINGGGYRWYIGTSEKMTITSAGNVGIGTTSPGEKFTIVTGTNYAAAFNTSSIEDTTTRISIGSLTTGAGGTGGSVAIGAKHYHASTAQSSMLFYTHDGSSLTEKMRITSGGSLKVSTNGTYLGATYAYHELRQTTSDTNITIFTHTSASPYGNNIYYPNASPNSTSNEFIYCNDSTQSKFIVWSNGSVVNRTGSYGTISDVKFKENIVDATPKLEDIAKLKVRNFNLKGESTKQIGFIAQEFEEVFPNMIDVSTERGEDGETYKSIKTSVLVPMLVKAVQELKVELDTLKNK